MNTTSIAQPADQRQLDMGLALAARACLAQLPALAQRRLRSHLDEVTRLEAVAIDSEGAQRLSRRLFGLLANASVHYGGADTLRPLFDELSRLRIYLVLQAHLMVRVPEVLRPGTPDLVAHSDGVEVGIDIRARRAEVLAEGNGPRLLIVDRTGLARREPPLLLGAGYAGEFHLHDARRDSADGAAFALVSRAGERGIAGRAVHPARLAEWTSAGHGDADGRNHQLGQPA